MRLLKLSPNGEVELISCDNDFTLPYAILSHTWGEQEVTYGDIVSGKGKNMIGYTKIRFCVEKAASDGLQYSWIDTCCIDKTTSDEISTAINSMFRWYQAAKKCYVYLSDVRIPAEVDDAEAFPITWKNAFRQSRWFTRGWTLQELLAPQTVEFFSREGKRLGSKLSLERDICEITKIPLEALRGQSLDKFSVEERMLWTTNRMTKLQEDKIYCLLGIFGVFLPLIYGEGQENAAKRMKWEIEKRQQGWSIRSIHNLMAPSAKNLATSRIAINDYQNENMLSVTPTMDALSGQPKPTIWSLGNIGQGLQQKRYFEVPTARKIAKFIGQSQVISEIDVEFSRLFSGDQLTPHIVTLVGMGGIGKTQIALEYSKLAYERKLYTFDDVFWFNASSEKALLTDFIKFSTILAPADKMFNNEQERVAFVLSMFSSWRSHLLIVFDNFDDPAFTDVLEYLPVAGACGILLTSRLREAGSEFGGMIEIPLMTTKDAIDVLLTRLRLKTVPDDQYADCENVVKQLGSLPLALEQAGAYMANGGGQMSFKNFAKIYEIRKKEIMKATPRFWKYTNISEPEAKSASLSILTTWELSLQRLGSSPADRAKKIHFLTILCFLDPNRISRLFFKSYLKFCHEISAYTRSGDWMSIFSSSASLLDETKFQDVISEMGNLSLIRHSVEECLNNNSVIAIHPLIRDWAEFRQDDMARAWFAREAIQIVASLLVDHMDSIQIISIDSMLPIREGLDEWQFVVFVRNMMSEILAHMDACVSRWEKLEISTTAAETTANGHAWQLRFSKMYQAAAQFDNAYEMLERMYRTAVDRVGENDEYRLDISMALCTLRIQQGRGSEVRTKLLEIIEHQKPPERGDVELSNCIMAQFWLAQLYTGQGNTQSATELAKSLLNSFMLINLKTDLEVKLVVGLKVGHLLKTLDLREDSYRLCSTLTTRYKELTKFSPNTSSNREKELMCMLDVSVIHKLLSLHEQDQKAGYLNEAQNLLRGVDRYSDPSTTSPMDRITLEEAHGLVAAAKGLWLEAIQRAELVYKYTAEALGSAHSLTIQRVSALIRQFIRSPQHDTDGALRIANEALHSAIEQLGETHPWIVNLQTSLAATFLRENCARLAIPFSQDLVRIFAQKAASKNTELADAQTVLVACLCSLSDRSEEETKQAVSVLRSLIKLEHQNPDIDAEIKVQIQRREKLALLLRANGNYTEALQLYSEALVKQLSLMNKDVNNVWFLRQSIAFCHRHHGDTDVALEILKELEKDQERVLDDIRDNNISLSSYEATLYQMGDCYAALDFDQVLTAYEDAKQCYERGLAMHIRRAKAEVSKDIAFVQRLLGKLHSKRGYHMEAAESYERACQFSRQAQDEDYYFDIVHVGDEFRFAKTWGRQRDALLEQLAWTKSFRGPDSPETMWTLAALAVNAENLNDTDSSLRYYHEELALRRAIFVNSPGKNVDCMISITRLCYELEKFEEARSTISEAFHIWKTSADYDQTKESQFLMDLAIIEVGTENWTAAADYCQQILDCYRGLDQDCDDCGFAETYLGRALSELNQLDEAVDHAVRGLQLRKKMHGDEHVSTMKSCYWVATIRFKQGNYEQAAELLERCLPTLRKVKETIPHLEKLWVKEVTSREAILQDCREVMQESIKNNMALLWLR